MLKIMGQLLFVNVDEELLLVLHKFITAEQGVTSSLSSSGSMTTRNYNLVRCYFLFVAGGGEEGCFFFSREAGNSPPPQVGSRIFFYGLAQTVGTN